MNTVQDGKSNESGQRVIRTVKGREIAADLILLYTGQTPNTSLLHDMDNRTIVPDSWLAHVLPTLQLGVLQEPVDDLCSKIEGLTAKDTPTTVQTPYPHIFVIGDAADAFGAIKAGHNAYYQAQVAVRNILKLSEQSADSKPEELETYY